MESQRAGRRSYAVPCVHRDVCAWCATGGAQSGLGPSSAWKVVSSTHLLLPASSACASRFFAHRIPHRLHRVPRPSGPYLREDLGATKLTVMNE